MSCQCTTRQWQPTDPRAMERMLALVAHFKAHNCCSLCSLGFALAEVEREAGRKFEKPKSCETCRAKAVACYHQMPKKE
jgi:hypothetical protein